jgi:hypothetical protein
MRPITTALAGTAAAVALIAGPVLVTPAINASAPASSLGISIPTEDADAASFYRWGESCAWKRIAGQDHTNKLWAERRQDVWFGHVKMGCKLTGHQKWSYGSPISPWYDSSGKRIR